MTILVDIVAGIILMIWLSPLIESMLPAEKKFVTVPALFFWDWVIVAGALAVFLLKG